ncbi:MAG: hypothetical protein RMI88_03105 [Nitrososphaerota archaeon]|nr:hypothetical protein [Nitrososphaerota archaeon]
MMISLKKIHLLPITILIVLTIIQSYPLLYGKYTWNTGSIESAYIAQSRMLSENFPVPGWNPLWYGGHPFKLSYSPGFLYVVQLASILLGVDIPEAYRRVTVLTLIILPLTIYFFIYSLSRSVLAGSLSSIIYLCFPSIHRLIYVYPDMQPYPDHITLIGLYGETPHLLGLSLALITVTLFYHHVESREKIYLMIIVFIIAFVNMVNLIAAVSLLIFLLSIAVLSGWGAFKKFLILYFFGWGLCLFVYDYEYLNALTIYLQLTMNKQTLTTPYIVVIILVLSSTFALARFLQSKTGMKALAATLPLAVVFLLVVGFNRFAGIELLPQAIRYNPEFDISLYGLAVSLLFFSLNRLRRYSVVVITVLLAVAIIYYAEGLHSAWNIYRVGDHEIEDSLEKKIADFINELPGDRFGPRVYSTGSIAFWLNVFNGKPQVRGGFDEVPGSINPMWAHISYFVNNSPNSTLSIKWLKAFNVRYVIVDFPSARLPYKDYRYPEKFENKLNVIRDIDNVKVYEVPLDDSRPIQLVKKTDHIPILRDIQDIQSLERYLELIEDMKCGHSLYYNVVSNNLIDVEIKELGEDCYLIFKVNYDNGWRAYLDKVELKPNLIGPGFIYYNLSGVRGDVKIMIRYVGENALNWVFNMLSIIFLAMTILYFFVMENRIVLGRSLIRFKKYIQAK